MIRDQLVEKTNSSRIRESLLLESELTLQKAITLASHIETVLADAQAMAKTGDAVVGAVQGTTFRGGGRRTPSHFQRKESRSAPKPTESSNPSAGPYLRAPLDCRYAITLVDYYSKWPVVAFTSEVTSATVIQFLFTVFSREGNPLELVTDNGSAFVSAEFKAFLAS
ncbi:hypothetical protein COCON_G00111640 [Conger conger]|uniref:Integrase catalytic domain-containing protein n=1 Tax=Conger conger TaxID=82655 RepID=A0A9Q1DJT6_CONCO|nr:hypothetical protein COCON_G00111640 [Conger conger]